MAEQESTQRMATLEEARAIYAEIYHSYEVKMDEVRARLKQEIREKVEELRKARREAVKDWKLYIKAKQSEHDVHGD